MISASYSSAILKVSLVSLSLNKKWGKFISKAASTDCFMGWFMHSTKHAFLEKLYWVKNMGKFRLRERKDELPKVKQNQKYRHRKENAYDCRTPNSITDARSLNRCPPSSLALKTLFADQYPLTTGGDGPRLQQRPGLPLDVSKITGTHPPGGVVSQ